MTGKYRFFLMMLLFLSILTASIASLAQTPAPPYEVEAELSDNQLYTGELVRYRFIFYTRMSLSESPDYVEPDFEQFWQSEPTVLPFQTVQRNGTTYQKLVVETQLIPLTSGQHSIPPAELRLRNEDDTQQILQTNEPLLINVEALPPAPANFSGLVGTFDLIVPDRISAQSGDVFEYYLTVTGTGYLQQISLPDINWPTGWDILQRNTEQTENSLTFRWQLSSQRPAEERIRVQIIYFDPDSEAYEVRRAPVTEIIIEGDELPPNTSELSTPVPEPVTSLAPITVSYRISYSWLQSGWLWVLPCLMTGVAIGFAGFWRIARERNWFILRKICGRINRAAQEDTFYQDIESIYIDYLRTRLKLPETASIPAHLNDFISHYLPRSETIQPLQQFISRVDRVRFTDEPRNPQQHAREAIRTLKQFHRTWNPGL